MATGDPLPLWWYGGRPGDQDSDEYPLPSEILDQVQQMIVPVAVSDENSPMKIERDGFSPAAPILQESESEEEMSDEDVGKILAAQLRAYGGDPKTKKRGKKRLIKRLHSLSSSGRVEEFLFNFKSMYKQTSQFKNGSRIPVQPSTSSRRYSQYRGNKKLPAGRPAGNSKKAAKKRKRNLEENIRQNVANSKPHGSRH